MEYAAPVLRVPNVEDALRYYTRELGFDEWFSIKDGQGRVAFAGVMRGHAHLMFGTPGDLSADDLRVVTQGTELYLEMGDEDIDALYERVRDRVNVIDPIADRYWGDRVFVIKDPFGYQVSVSKSKEHLSNEELSKRAQESRAASS